MKKVIVGGISLLMIVVSILGIGYLLNPSILAKDQITTITTKKMLSDYEIVNLGKNFVSYQLNEDIIENFELDLNTIKIIFKDNELVIDDDKIIKEVKLYKYFALYEDSTLVVIADDIETNKAHIIIYDIYNKNYEILSSYNGMNIVFENDIYFEDIGFIFNTSIVDGNLIEINNSVVDICNIKDPELVVKRKVEYLYDINENDFANFDELSSFSLDSYVTVNKLC